MDAHEWDTRYAATETMWSTEPNSFLVAKVEGLRPGRALDIGCGEGRNALWLAEHGWDVTAVDFSQVAIDRGRGWARQRGLTVGFEVVDVVDYSPQPAAYDLVIVFYLQLPHDEVRQVIRHAVAGLAPGGTLLVVAHDLGNLEHGYGGPPTAEVLYTADLVTDVIESLDVIEAGTVTRSIATEHGEETAIDTLVLARQS